MLTAEGLENKKLMAITRRFWAGVAPFLLVPSSSCPGIFSALRSAESRNEMQFSMSAPIRRRPQVACRFFVRLGGVAVASVLLLAARLAHAAHDPNDFSKMAEKLLPSVVNIEARLQLAKADLASPDLQGILKQFFAYQNHRDTSGGPRGRSILGATGNSKGGDRGGTGPQEAASLGSGLIIDPAGYIVTDNHVVQGAKEITVRMQGGGEYKARMIGHDLKTDLALLKIDAPEALPAAQWGDSDKARVGDWILAIGNPFGFGGTVTAGIISARQRNINAGPYDDFIQTDAAINRGNWGGPVFDAQGKVIGITTMIYSPSGGSIGLGFAVPSSLAKLVVVQLRQYGHPRRGWLGVSLQSVTPELAEGLKMAKATGALITVVSSGSPADTAGIRRGDVVIRFNGQAVKEMHDLPRFIAEAPLDSPVTAMVLRQGKPVSVQVQLRELDAE